MSNYTPVPSAPPAPGSLNCEPPPAYNTPSVGPSSYGSVDYDGYQPQYNYPQTTYPQNSGYATAPQPSGYQQYNTTSAATVVRTQPSVPKYRAPKPSSHIWLSVFTMLCCCFVLGLIAVIVGMEVDSAYNGGDHAKARRKSKQALGLSIAAIAFGVVVHMTWIGPAIYLVVIWSTASSS